MSNNLVPLLEVLEVSSQLLKEKWCTQLLYKLNIIHNSFENFHCNVCFDNLMVDRKNNLILVNVSEKSKSVGEVQKDNVLKAPELVGKSIRSKPGDIWAAGICIYYINNLFYPWKIAANTDERYCGWAKNGILPSNLENNTYLKILKQMLCVDLKLRPSVKKLVKQTHDCSIDVDDLS